MTRTIKTDIVYKNYSYDFTLEVTNDDLFQIIEERLHINGKITILTRNDIETGHKHTEISNIKLDDKAVLTSIRSLGDTILYHFPDTSPNVGIRRGSSKTDTRNLKGDASNLPSILYKLKKSNTNDFEEIERRMRLIAPYFHSFDLRIDPSNNDIILLEWRHSYNQQIFGPNELSDGTIRAMAILTAIFQDNSTNRLILFDEPELGLHPKAITFIGEAIKSRSNLQSIVGTQSPKFLNNYQINEVLVIEYEDGKSEIIPPDIHYLQSWLEDYTVGEVWEKNIIGGRPK